MAPAPTAYQSSGMVPKVMPKAKTRSRLYLQDVAVVAGLQPAEGQRAAHGPVEDEDAVDGARAGRHDVGVPAHLHVLFLELVLQRAAVAAGHGEDEDAALLQLAHDVDGRLIVRRRPQDGGEARHAAVHELDADLAHGRVAQEAEVARVRLEAVEVLDRARDLLREHGGRAGVQPGAQVGQPDLFARFVGQQLLADVLEDGLALGQGLDLAAGQRQDHGQSEGGLGELELGLLAMLVDRLLPRLFGLPYELMRSAYDGNEYLSGHPSSPIRP